MKQSGKSKIFGIIGNPVSHSLSPKMHNAAFDSAELNAVYLPFPVNDGQLENALKGCIALGISGLNVTVPYKEAVLPYLDTIDSQAKTIAAVNTICFEDGKSTGYNTDGDGFILSLKQELQFSFKNKNIVLLGAGGSTKSIAFSLSQEKPSSIMILNRTPEKAEQLIQALELKNASSGLLNSHWDRLESADLIINTTSVGLGSLDCPLEKMSWVNPSQLCYDIIYSPSETTFLKEAALRGARTLNGLGMLAGQGALAFTFFTGKSIPYSFFKGELCKK